MVLSGAVFDFGRRPAPLRPNYEVAEAYWISLTHLWDPEQVTRFAYASGSRSMAAIRFGEQIIWGLTLRVLTRFAEILGRPLPT